MRFVVAVAAALLAGHAHGQVISGGSNFLATGTGPLGIGTPSQPLMTGLNVSGNQLRNGSGVQVQLRGVNKAGTEYMCPGNAQAFDGPTDQAHVNTLVEWAVNVVRLPVNDNCWLGINGATFGGTSYRNAVKAYVDLLTANNIASIIDLQFSSNGSTLATSSSGENGGLNQMPGNHAVDFWTSAANTFKDNGSVIFDLFNEPFPDNNSTSATAFTCLRDGGAGCGMAYSAVGMQAMLDAVRATGATNVVMVGCVQFANICSNGTQTWATHKPTDPLNQLVVSMHNYQIQGCNSTSCWNTYLTPLIASYPLVWGELGQNNCQGDFITTAMDWADPRMVGYLGWAWNPYDCASFPAMISDYDGTPSDFGYWFRERFRSRAGLPPIVPPTIPFFCSSYPCGIAVGRGSDYTAGDGTVYKQDPYVQATNGTFTVATGLRENMQFFQPFTTADTITGTSDPALYQTGRHGVGGVWTIDLPNGAYTVTLGMAFNSTYHPPPNGNPLITGPWGQDQYINGATVGQCIWSAYSGGNNYPGDVACPQPGSVFVPTTGTAYTVSYTVNVYNQHLAISVQASFGGGRETILNSIKVAVAP